MAVWNVVNNFPPRRTGSAADSDDAAWPVIRINPMDYCDMRTSHDVYCLYVYNNILEVVMSGRMRMKGRMTYGHVSCKI